MASIGAENTPLLNNHEQHLSSQEVEEQQAEKDVNLRRLARLVAWEASQLWRYQHPYCPSVRVSNKVGVGHSKVAKFSMFVVNILISIFFSSIVLCFKSGLSRLFSSDSEVINLVTNLTPLLAISILLNGVQPILSGVAIGSGWQGLVAYVNVAAYYVVGLPVGCILGFMTTLGVAGIWWGMILGILLQTVTLINLTATRNWDVEVQKAVDGLKKSVNTMPTLEIIDV